MDQSKTQSKTQVRPNLDRKEFERLRNAWKSTLANLEHHLVNDQF